jgi:VWFA-related protein
MSALRRVGGCEARILVRVATLTTIFLLAYAALGQESPLPTIRSASTLVAVPTSVRLPSGELVKQLDADRFQLFDNGIPQKVMMEPTEKQPIAVVVLMQTGGLGAGEFENYRNLPRMLDSIIGDRVHEIMLVTFDSRIRATWHFPPRSDGVDYALTRPIAGDDGAAILDAVNYVIDQFQQEPGDFRRIVLLLSQSRDDGSGTSPEEVVRHLGESSTCVYSLTFLPHKLPPQFRSRNQAANPRRTRSSSDPRVNDPADMSTPGGVALRAMRTNTAEEIAVLSGGEHLRFRDQPDFESQLSMIADDIHNRSLLSFQPTSHEPGFHTLAVRVAGQQGLRIAARTSYWFDAGGAEK